MDIFFIYEYATLINGSIYPVRNASRFIGGTGQASDRHEKLHHPRFLSGIDIETET